MAGKKPRKGERIVDNYLPDIVIDIPSYDPGDLKIIYSYTEEGMRYTENTQNLKRTLYIRKNKLYDTDPEYNSASAWLLNNRQGDEYVRVPERIPNPAAAIATGLHIDGESDLARDEIWKSTIVLEPVRMSRYERALAYDEMYRDSISV